MSQHRVLLVDDDPSLLRLLSLRLRAEQYAVETAESAEQALSKLAICQPHLVITDLKMDDMDGVQLFDRIHQQQPTLPVILLTAHGSISGAVDATRRGFYSYLTKPFDSKDLLREMREALQHAPSDAPTEPDSGAAGDGGWRARIITCSGKMAELLARAQRIAHSEASVLIQGPSGSGKELIAGAIHAASPRAAAPFVAINCAAIPDNLLESELFGHKKGAFTGADRNRTGLVESANGGTLFLDEAGDMPLEFQAKLLRFLEERRVRPVGSSSSIDVDVRLVSATHVDLERAVETGKFREDLYYRLNVVALDVPALAERREDIKLLANHFMQQVIERNPHCQARSFSPEALNRLISAPWPGNVRQLRNVIEQVCVLSSTQVISEQLVGGALRGKDDAMQPLAEAQSAFERDYLMSLLRTTAGNVTQAAKLAKRNRTEFYKLLNKHKLDAALFRQSN